MDRKSQEQKSWKEKFFIIQLLFKLGQISDNFNATFLLFVCLFVAKEKRIYSFVDQENFALLKFSSEFVCFKNRIKE